MISSASPLPKRLVVDRIPQDFRLGLDLALGSWCFQGHETQVEGWEDIAFPIPFPTQAALHQAGETSRLLAHRLLDEMWPAMNRRHGLNHGRRFWRSVMMPWLIHLTMVSWRLWLYCDLFIAAQGDEPLTVLAAEVEGEPVVGGSEAFFLALFNRHPLLFWMMQETLRRQAPPHWRFENALPPMVFAVPASGQPGHLRWEAVDSIEGLGLLRRPLSLYTRLTARPGRPEELTYPAGKPDVPAAYWLFLSEIAARTMPHALGDGFAALYAKVSTLDFSARSHVCTLPWSNDGYNLAAALAREAGQRVISVQHGGNYGWGSVVPMLGEAEYANDRFVTWGWTAQEDYPGDFRPMSSPMLSLNIGKARETTSEMILIGAAMLSFYPRIDFYPEFLSYRRNKATFIEALGKDLRRSLRYRPYNLRNTFDDADWLRRRFPDMQTVKGLLTPAMMNCRLTVQDHPSTSLSITLAANKPTICFWQPDHWPLARQAVPVFDGMRKAGMLFDDPAEAAKHIRTIWDDVPGWWRSEAVQAARRDWCDQYARASRFWLLEWLWKLPSL